MLYFLLLDPKRDLIICARQSGILISLNTDEDSQIYTYLHDKNLISPGPKLITGQSIAWGLISDEIPDTLLNKPRYVKEKTTHIYNQLSTTTVDPNLCALILLNPYMDVKHAKLVKVFVSIPIASLQGDYFNQWYDDNTEFFQSLHLPITFEADSVSVKVDNSAFLSQEQIDSVQMRLFDIGKYSQHSVWCTLIIDGNEFYIDLTNTPTNQIL